MNFVFENIDDILKPKRSLDYDNKIYSIMERRPLSQQSKIFFQKAIRLAKVDFSEYDGPVPEEEHGWDFWKVSGHIWELFRFLKILHPILGKKMSDEELIEYIKERDIK